VAALELDGVPDGTEVQLVVNGALQDGTPLLSSDCVVIVPPTCVCDLDSDGSVGIVDLFGLLAAWDTDPGGPPDFDEDGNVGINDLFAMFGNWGNCP
jgi:hypothetical protein